MNDALRGVEGGGRCEGGEVQIETYCRWRQEVGPW